MPRIRREDKVGCVSGGAHIGFGSVRCFHGVRVDILVCHGGRGGGGYSASCTMGATTTIASWQGHARVRSAYYTNETVGKLYLLHTG